MSAWTIRIEAETDASAERALQQALKSLPLAEDDSAPYRLEINSEDVSDGPFDGEINEALQRSKERTDACRLTWHDGSPSSPVPLFKWVRYSTRGQERLRLNQGFSNDIDWSKVAWYQVADEAETERAVEAVNGRT